MYWTSTDPRRQHVYLLIFYDCTLAPQQNMRYSAITIANFRHCSSLLVFFVVVTYFTTNPTNLRRRLLQLSIFVVYTVVSAMHSVWFGHLFQELSNIQIFAPFSFVTKFENNETKSSFTNLIVETSRISPKHSVASSFRYLPHSPATMPYLSS